MDRVEFIRRTSMNDSVKSSIIQSFWDQYMLLYELGGGASIEAVSPLPSDNTTSFMMVMTYPEAATDIANMINHNSLYTIYHNTYKVSAIAHPEDCSIVVEICRVFM